MPEVSPLSQAKVIRTNGKKLAPAFAIIKQDTKVVLNPLFEKMPENFRIRQYIQPLRDLT